MLSDQETLKACITKAIEGGWSKQGLTDEGKMHFTDTGVVVDWLRGGRTAYSLETIIFNHDFAKALWGEAKPLTRKEFKEMGYTGNMGVTTVGWDFHLQNMVIAEDRISYLRENA